MPWQAVLTTWYPWAALVAIFFFLVFRSSIADLIRRIVGFGRGGVTALPHGQPTEAAVDPRRAADQLLGQLDTPFIREQEETLRRELQGRGLTDTSPDTIRVLTRSAAALWVMVDFERIYNLIYGSQLQILGHLNAVPGAQDTELRPFYDTAVRGYADVFRAYPFEQYMNYLVSQRLIAEQGNTFTITVKGREFLTYLIRQGKSFQRAL